MTEKQINITLRIKFESAFIIGSGFGAAGIVDLKTVKDANGVIYLPASSLKGKIRAEFRKVMYSLNEPICNLPGQILCKSADINKACVICRIFGSEFYEGNVVFDDAIMDQDIYDVFEKTESNRVFPQFQAAIRTGIRVDRKRKVVSDEALFMLETANPCAAFTAHIHGTSMLKDDEYELFCQVIESITHLGGNKSRGLGKCTLEIDS